MSKKNLFFLVIVIIVVTLAVFLFKAVFFPTHLIEVCNRAGIEQFDVNPHHSLSTRNVWGTLTLDDENLGKLVSYLKVKKMEFKPEIYEKYFDMMENDNIDLSREETQALDDRVYSDLYLYLRNLKETTNGEWQWENLEDYSFYLTAGRPPELRFENGQNFEFLFIAIDPKTGKGVYLASYAYG